MNIATTLVQASTVFAKRPALCLGTQMTQDYAGLARRTASLAASLRQMVPQQGARVAIFLANRPEYLEILYAIWAAGLVAVPVNAKLHPRELDFILKDCGAEVLFADQAIEVPQGCRLINLSDPAYKEIAGSDMQLRVEDAAAEDLAWIFYTSGTTGAPKGAMLTHRNLWAMILAFLADFCPVTKRSSALHLAPLSHAAGLFGIAYTLRGVAHVIPQSGGFDTQELAQLLRHYQGCSFFAAPTMLQRLVSDLRQSEPDARNAALAGLDMVMVGGAPLYVEDLRAALDVLGPRIWVAYGQGEAPCTISYLPHHLLARPEEMQPQWFGSVGTARSGVNMRVVDEAGVDCPPGTPGEVIVQGDVVMAGYWNNPEATAAALRDGWLYTGDIGALDENGFLTLLDRSKDVIISGGSNIYPREVEEVLLAYPGVVEVNVIGRPHPEWGEEVVAFIAGDPNVTPEALDRHCLSHIARFKRPREYRFLPSLPKSSYGKILKIELRKLI